MLKKIPTVRKREQTTGFQPSETQSKVLHAPQRIIEVTGGIQSGKSEISADFLTTRYWLGNLYWLIGPDYDQCREEFGYLVRNFEALGMVKNCHFPSRDQCTLDIAPNIRIETKSAKYPAKIAGRACDGIIMCEPGQIDFEIFQRAIERLSTKQGWLLLAGTLETSNDWMSDKYKEYQNPGNADGGVSFAMPTWENKEKYPGGRTDPEIVRAENILGPERFQERYGGVPLKPRGVVLPEFKAIMHTGDFRLDTKEDVFLGIDPGYFPSVYAVEFIQFIGDETYVFDEIYEQHLGTDQIIQMVARKPYAGLIKSGAIDIASKQHHGSQPDYMIWKTPNSDTNWGGLSLDSRRINPISDGVNRMRTFLRPHPLTGLPQVHISSRCRGILSELGVCKPPEGIDQGGIWRMKMDSKGTILSPEPEDKHNHATKGLIYAMVSHFGLGIRPRKSSVSSIDI